MRKPDGGTAAASSAIVSTIEEDIVLGWLQPRERLVEADLAERFGAKRHVIREVLFELDRMGLVEHAPNRGASVRSLSQKEVEQIYDVRQTLEEMAARQMIVPVSPKQLEELEAIQARHSQAVEKHDPRAAFRANMAFHDTLFAGIGNPYLAEAIRMFAQKVHVARSLTAVDPDHLERARQEHLAMIDALRIGDLETLAELCRVHITPSRDAYISAIGRRLAGGRYNGSD